MGRKRSSNDVDLAQSDWYIYIYIKFEFYYHDIAL